MTRDPHDSRTWHDSPLAPWMLTLPAGEFTMGESVGDKFANDTYGHGIQELIPNTNRASPQQVLHFQQKVGSLLYATVISRPDAAKTGK